MSDSLAIHLIKQLLWQAITIASPLLVVILIVGFTISILQATTQIQDSTVSTIPKLLSAIVVLIALSDWMLHRLITYTTQLFVNIPSMVQS
jgi:flagellar biosynthetic protein FliQ